MSNESAASVKEQVRKDWAEGARAWGKWRRELTSQSKEATDVLIEAAQLRPGMRVLDIASGTGEPALSIATALGAKGEVVATDLTTEMLAVAEADAHERRLKNVRFQQADAEALPFPDESFDRVTCRFGIMFCPRPGQALREMRRVLKPGGRVALVTWGPPDKNPFFATAMGPFMKRLPMPPPDPDAPSPFRFAQPAPLEALIRDAGFREAKVTARKIAWPFEGTPERAWQYIQEMAGATFRPLLEKVGAQRGTVEAEVVAAIRSLYDGRSVNYPALVNVGAGER